jgi:N-acetylglucosamine-6-phosphate deacetylase
MTKSTKKTATDILNARVLGKAELQQIQIRQGKVDRILAMSAASRSPKVQLLDVAGDWISLGGVDLQINGALGWAFTETFDETSLQKICQFLWEQGVDGFLPTLVTTAVENINRSLAVIANFSPPDLPAAEILGVHLEGPFLNPAKRGAHPAEYLLPLTIENVKRVLGDCAHIIKVMTLAPELDPTGEVIPYLRSLGITVSLGHSQATAAQAQQAFDLGATMVTHAFNAMPALHHREPGLLGAALVRPGVWCGAIADGQHICPIMLQILLAAGGCDQGLFLVSDALAPLGLPDGIYPWDRRQIEVKNGTARLPDGTLSGTTLPLLVGAQNLVKWGLCEPATAIALATESPRKAIGLPATLVGHPANLLRWHLDKSTSELSAWRINSQLYKQSPPARTNTKSS